MGTNLLDVKPKDLKFTFELKKQSFCTVQLTNITDNEVAFKVKTTSPNKYCVRPNVGVVPPHTTTKFTITMQAPKVAPLELICKDKFLVQSTIVSPGTDEQDITTNLFSKNSGNYVEEVKLKVTLVSPPLSPLTESEDVDETVNSKDIAYKEEKPSVYGNSNGVADVDVKAVKKPIEVDDMKAWRKPIEVADMSLKPGKKLSEVAALDMKLGKKLKEFTDVEIKPRIKHNDWDDDDTKAAKKFNESNDVDMKPGKKFNESNDVDMKAERKPSHGGWEYSSDGNDHIAPSPASLRREEAFESEDAAITKAAQSQERVPLEATIATDIDKMKTQLNSLESKLELAERTIGKLSEERRMSIHERKVLQDEVVMLKRTHRQKKHPGFPLLFVVMVAMMSAVLGYLSHHQN